METKTNLGVLVVFSNLLSLCASANVYDGVADVGQNGNPGAKVRITQKGLDYLNNVLLYEMNQILPRLHLDDVQHSEGQGHIHISQGRVTNYKPPNTQTMTLQAPDQIIWATSGANIAMTGHVQGSYGRFADEGDADVFANDINFVISIQPIRQGNGQFGAVARSCQADIGALDFNIYNSGGVGRMIQNMKGPLLKRMKPHLTKQICRQATKLIDQAANEQLANIPTKVPLNESAEHMFNKMAGHQSQSNRKSNNGKGKSNHDSDNMFDVPDDPDPDVQNEMIKNITKHLTFDYSNLKDPVVQSRFVETYNKGEISYHGQGGTPFWPPPMRESSTIPTDRMAYLLASDYVANSMLFNSYNHDLLRSHISADDTPDFKDYLRTSCDSDSLFDMCLGSIVPEMRDSFPDSQAEINAEASRAPAVFFRKDGVIDIVGQGLVKLVAAKKGERKTMAVATLDLSAKAKLFLSNDSRVKGNCSIDKYEINMKENNLKGFNLARQKEFGELSKSMLQQIMNVYLKNGLRLPSMKGVKLRNAKLNVYDRTVRLDTDVEADKEVLTSMAVKVIQKHGGRVDGYN